MSVQEILSSKMCRDTFSIVQEYLCGDQDHWKGKYKPVVDSLNIIFRFIKIGNFLQSRQRRYAFLRRSKSSGDFKRHIGKILTFHPTEAIYFEMRVEKITNEKVVFQLPTGKRKYAKIVKDRIGNANWSAVVFTHRNYRFIFNANDLDQYQCIQSKHSPENDFINEYFVSIGQ